MKVNKQNEPAVTHIYIYYLCTSVFIMVIAVTPYLFTITCFAITTNVRYFGDFWKMTGPVVNVEQGRLQGTVRNGHNGQKFYSFQGIPYAEPPVGELRFKVSSLILILVIVMLQYLSTALPYYTGWHPTRDGPYFVLYKVR